ncbi:IS200/IS605 family transposase, partial [Thiolapillus sp.]
MPDKALRTGRHCVFMLHANLIFITKYRGKVLSRAMLRDMEKIMRDVCAIQDVTLAEFNGETDHVHLLVEYPPTVQLSKLINSLKGVSS